MEKTKSYCITKKISLHNGREVTVVLVDAHEEILEFDDKQKAKELAELLTINSDSGWVYKIKEI